MMELSPEIFDDIRGAGYYKVYERIDGLGVHVEFMNGGPRRVFGFSENRGSALNSVRRQIGIPVR